MTMQGYQDNASLLGQALAGGTAAGSIGNSLSRTATKTTTWTGASGLGLNGTTTTWFTVASGLVVIEEISGRITTDHTDSNVLATLALGVVGSTSLFIAATTVLNVTGFLTATPIWMSTTPTAGGLAIPAACKQIVIGGNIITTVGGTGNITGGVLEINVKWHPLTPAATLV